MSPLAVSNADVSMGLSVFAAVCVLGIVATIWGPALLAWAVGWWSALGGNVESRFDEGAWFGDWSDEATKPRPLDWKDFPEWRALGRPVERPENVERRKAA